MAATITNSELDGRRVTSHEHTGSGPSLITNNHIHHAQDFVFVLNDLLPQCLDLCLFLGDFLIDRVELSRVISLRRGHFL